MATEVNARPGGLMPEAGAGGAAQKRGLGAWGVFGLYVAGLCVCYSIALFDWVRFALTKDLYSHALLIPAVSFYLGWSLRRELPVRGTPCWIGAGGLSALGVAGLAAYWYWRAQGAALTANDYLACVIFSLVCWVGAGGFVLLGKERLRFLAFPAVFLVFMVPFPAAIELGFERFLQHASATVVHGLFALSGTPVLRDDLVFQLPGIRIQVAEECSGIRSTLVLFITSLVAGYLFLRSPWRRAGLVAAVIPLGILRNAVRIFVICFLCIHLDPSWIDSDLHHRGGPLFFLVSLVPLALLLIWFWKAEAKFRKAKDTPPQ
jgi:exosortase C (VPDSG-CTERM-specific)